MKNPLFLRIVVPSLAVSALLLALGVLSAWYVHRQQKEALRIEAEGVARIRLAEKMVSAIRQVRSCLDRFTITGEREHLEELHSAAGAIWENLAKAEALSGPDDADEILLRIRRVKKVLSQELVELRTDPVDEVRKAARNLANAVAIEQILALSQKYLDLSDTVLVRNGTRLQDVADRIGLSLLLLGVCGSVAGLVAGFAVARAIRLSILDLYVPIRAAEGKLEEVVGPIHLDKPVDLDDIDSVLESLSDRIGTVVDRFQQSQLHLLRAEQLAAVGQLAAGLAHELRNPLMAMKILIQTAAEAGESGCLQGRDLSVVAEETARLEQAINRFLDFARPPRLERHVFDIRRTLQQTLDLIAARAARQGVLIHKAMPDQPLEVNADPEQIRQVFLNTILNSLDMLPQGGNIRLGMLVEPSAVVNESGSTEMDAAEKPGEPAASAEGLSSTTTTEIPSKDDAAPRWVVVTIADDGPGIPDDIRQRIFDPFVSSKETGLGLGLAICRRIVEAHDGQITAGDSADGGAEFMIRLPLGKPPS